MKLKAKKQKKTKQKKQKMLGETLVTKSRLVIALRLFRREISKSFWDQSQSEGSETETILDFFTWKQKSKLLHFYLR